MSKGWQVLLVVVGVPIGLLFLFSIVTHAIAWSMRQMDRR